MLILFHSQTLTLVLLTKFYDTTRTNEQVKSFVYTKLRLCLVLFFSFNGEHPLFCFCGFFTSKIYKLFGHSQVRTGFIFHQYAIDWKKLLFQYYRTILNYSACLLVQWMGLHYGSSFVCQFNSIFLYILFKDLAWLVVLLKTIR